MKTNNRSGSFLGRLSRWLSKGVLGVLEGFDRLRFRGTLRYLYSPQVFEAYLCAQHVQFREFRHWSERTTAMVCDASEAFAKAAGRPVEYVRSSQRDKMKIAQEIAARDGINRGLIAVLSSVEPCRSYSLRKSRVSQNWEFQLEERKCLHYYFYFEHPRFGFMSVRLQSWVPFQLDICMNGRHWLARQLDEAGIAYRKRENAIVWVKDFEAAQKLLDQQIHLDWSAELASLCRQVHPSAEEICRPLGHQYYWSASDSEYATDLLFRDPDRLANIYPLLTHGAITTFSCQDVMRFLGRNVPTRSGRVRGNFQGEIISDLKHRPEGVRVKHSLNGNSLKVYDKQASVLRVETTITHCEQFKVFRKGEARTGTPAGKKQWRDMRRSVADMPRRAEVSKAANHRYLDALGDTQNIIPLFQWTKNVCRPVFHGNKRYRALNPFAAGDSSLLKAINRGEFAINGFRNRDLCRLLFPTKNHGSKKERRRLSSRIGRQIRILRAHGLVTKITHTHRYRLTPKGRVTVSALLAAHAASPKELTEATFKAAA